MDAKEALDSILMPRSIAVIVASKDPFKWGTYSSSSKLINFIHNTIDVN